MKELLAGFQLSGAASSISLWKCVENVDRGEEKQPRLASPSHLREILMRDRTQLIQKNAQMLFCGENILHLVENGSSSGCQIEPEMRIRGGGYLPPERPHRAQLAPVRVRGAAMP